MISLQTLNLSPLWTYDFDLSIYTLWSSVWCETNLIFLVTNFEGQSDVNIQIWCICSQTLNISVMSTPESLETGSEVWPLHHSKPNPFYKHRSVFTVKGTTRHSETNLSSFFPLQFLILDKTDFSFEIVIFSKHCFPVICVFGGTVCICSELINKGSVIHKLWNPSLSQWNRSRPASTSDRMTLPQEALTADWQTLRAYNLFRQGVWGHHRGLFWLLTESQPIKVCYLFCQGVWEHCGGLQWLMTESQPIKVCNSS